MEATKLIAALNAMREGVEKPPSHMELIRRAVAKMSAPEQPALFNDAQLQVFLTQVNVLQEFIESEDGADAIELLTNAFDVFAKSKEHSEVAANETAQESSSQES